MSWPKIGQVAFTPDFLNNCRLEGLVCFEGPITEFDDYLTPNGVRITTPAGFSIVALLDDSELGRAARDILEGRTSSTVVQVGSTDPEDQHTTRYPDGMVVRGTEANYVHLHTSEQSPGNQEICDQDGCNDTKPCGPFCRGRWSEAPVNTAEEGSPIPSTEPSPVGGRIEESDYENPTKWLHRILGEPQIRRVVHEGDNLQQRPREVRVRWEDPPMTPEEAERQLRKALWPLQYATGVTPFRMLYSELPPRDDAVYWNSDEILSMDFSDLERRVLGALSSPSEEVLQEFMRVDQEIIELVKLRDLPRVYDDSTDARERLRKDRLDRTIGRLEERREELRMLSGIGEKQVQQAREIWEQVKVVLSQEHGVRLQLNNPFRVVGESEEAVRERLRPLREQATALKHEVERLRTELFAAIRLLGARGDLEDEMNAWNQFLYGRI